MSRYYSKAITIMDVDQLGEVLLNELSEAHDANDITITVELKQNQYE